MAVDVYTYERVLRHAGFSVIAGVDEVGRGAIAGPMVAAAVILPEEQVVEGIRDSKALSPGKREALSAAILAAGTVGVSWAGPRTIRRLGLHSCNLWLLRRAVQKLERSPDYVLVDAHLVDDMPCRSLSLPQGDTRSASIAAASIVAKVSRDRLMVRLAERHPGYGWERNKGYPTQGHQAAVEKLGPTRLHRL
jgi:ribonuclease HII